MEAVFRTCGIYFFILLLFRVAGKRRLQDVTVFDFVLLLVISESVQQALTGSDYSLTNAWVVIATFIFLDISMSLLKQRFQGLARIVDSMPLLVMKRGEPLKERLERERLDAEDILEAARGQGLSRFDQIKYAVLERDGSISIIPWDKEEKR